MAVTAPVAVGDDILAEHINLFLNRPVCHLIGQATQAAADNATIVVQFGASSEAIDYTPAPFHDTVTNNTRITPTVAGWYRVSGKVAFAGLNPSDYLIVDAWLRTSGSFSVGGSSGRRGLPTGTGTINVVQVAHTGEHYIQFNGSTEYVELLGVQTNTGATASTLAASGQFASTLSVEFVRL